MELRQLATFRLLATNLNFTRTATVLNYVQSNVTAQIQALEEELGVRLFDRLGKRVTLTEVGERLLRYAEQIVDLADEMGKVASTKEDPMGALTISAPESLCTYLLPKLLQHFRSCYPQVRVQFRPSPVADLRRLVSEGMLDIAFVLEEPIHSTKLIVKQLFPEPLHVIAAPSHPLARVDQVEPADMEGETVLLTESGCSYRALFEYSLAVAGVQPATTLEFSSVEAIKQCVMVGMGISILPEMATRAEVEQGKLVVLPWRLPDVQVMTQMIWHKEKWLSPALGAFIDTAANMQW
jgi:DNA-binding transcriptional LysR family regulator